MTEPLSPDQLDLLLPVLRHVAEMVQKGADLNRDDLQLLLLPSGLDEEWATGELERWVKVLVAVRGVTDPRRRELAQRALMLRGIPEAAAMLAISIAAEAEREHPHRLTASVASLDLGMLSPGQAASAEFEVQGGPGQVVVDSDQVQVTPPQFGPGPTRIRVEVKPLAAGVLWTTLRLVTAGETLELPVVAQWVEDASPPRDIEMTTKYGMIFVPGSGDEFTLILAPGVEMVFVRVPAGDFLMGKERRLVYLQEYWIGKYLVTNLQYQQYQIFLRSSWQMPYGAEQHPVVNVAWEDASDFCRWLQLLFAIDARLPSEAEWEKAARGTDGREYPWGNEPISLHRVGTTPVGYYSPQTDSPYGCTDMVGHVWQWTSNPGNKPGRYVIRGGGYFPWEGQTGSCTDRSEWGPYGYKDVGFRVAMSFTKK